jgi:hypothetical protein
MRKKNRKRERGMTIENKKNRQKGIAKVRRREGDRENNEYER